VWHPLTVAQVDLYRFGLVHHLLAVAVTWRVQAARLLLVLVAICD
jgi:hypothetical protein